MRRSVALAAAVAALVAVGGWAPARAEPGAASTTVDVVLDGAKRSVQLSGSARELCVTVYDKAGRDDDSGCGSVTIVDGDDVTITGTIPSSRGGSHVLDVNVVIRGGGSSTAIVWPACVGCGPEVIEHGEGAASGSVGNGHPHLRDLSGTGSWTTTTSLT